MDIPTTSRDPNSNYTFEEHHAEMAGHRARLISEGFEPGSVELYFEEQRAYEANHRHDLTFRQRQDLGRWLGEKWVTGHAVPALNLTEEEREYLRERLDRVNDPVGQSILAKLQPVARNIC